MRLPREGVKDHGRREAVGAVGAAAGGLETDILLADRHLHPLSGDQPRTETGHDHEPAIDRDDDAARFGPSHRAAEKVRPPEKPRDEGRGRAAIHLLRPPDLLHAPALHDHHPVGQDEGLRLIVGDEDHRRPEALLQALQLDAHLVAQQGIEVRQRLVEQEHAGFGDQGAGESHALLLAAGELARIAGAQRAEPDQLQHALDARAPLRLPRASTPQTERDVVRHRHVREERVGLEDQAEVPAVDGHPRDVLPRQHDLPRVGRDEPGHDAEHRALATARRSQEGEKLAG